MALRIFKLEKQVTDTILLKKEIQDCEYIKKIAYKMQSNLDTYIENVLKLLKYRAQITPLIPINDSIIDEEMELIAKTAGDSSTSIYDLPISDNTKKVLRLVDNSIDIRKAIQLAIDKSIDGKINLLDS